jgi:Big-like domain-containing protein
VSAFRLKLTLLAALLLGAVGLLLGSPGAALAAAPKVTLSSPASGALIEGGQPTFRGTAVDSPNASGSVTVDVFAGNEVGSFPILVMQTQVTGGTFSVSPSAIPLGDGLYTAEVSESSGGEFPAIGYSNSVTFWVFNGIQRVYLDPPTHEPVGNSAPDFYGQASTTVGASTTAILDVYAGTTTDSTPLEAIAGTINSAGDFEIQVEPGLADGNYTMVVAQHLAGGESWSNIVKITVKAAAPSVTVTTPAAGGRLSLPAPLGFSGGAGDRYGDADTVRLALYAGSSTNGRLVGRKSVKRSGAHWSASWTTSLSPGTYTLRVTQQDDAGQTGSATRTFTVVSVAQFVDASSVRISSSGLLTVRAGCASGVSSCVGDVLINTRKSLQTQYGGPVGPLRLMFARFSLGGGWRVTLKAQLTSAQMSALRSAGPQSLAVTLSYRRSGKLSARTTYTSAVAVG